MNFGQHLTIKKEKAENVLEMENEGGGNIRQTVEGKVRRLSREAESH